ncbi:spore germination protein [Paenibacillus sp. HB172176]|uniref:spore germination protein n=1 Tax=Paenibacillus sp. HB172176 TaxID=2493690 RepID=UPI00143B9BDA|nr:spore germination protein [Paenibacillus sp. HB172176]
MKVPTTDISEQTGLSISLNLEDNLEYFKSKFAGCDDFIMDSWKYGLESGQQAFYVYFGTLSNPKAKTEFKAMLQKIIHEEVPSKKDKNHFYENNLFSSPSSEMTESLDKAAQFVLEGKVVLFFHNMDKALAYSAIDIEQRQASEPITEPSIQGPHVSMIESLDRNIGVIRNLLKTSRLKFEFFIAGEESRRKVSFGYLEGAVEPDALAAFKKRIAGLEKEEIIDPSYLESWIGESRFSPFPQVRYTERPDTAVLSLLNGKIIIMVDGSPSVLICPVHFMEFFTASDDYYFRPVYFSLIRILRMTALVIAFILPSTYIALSTFHSELIPTVLLLAILKTREGIPFPALLEAFIMEFFFELLREAGIRLPRPIGTAVSIVGALVIGQAAIQSQIASPVMVIVVALTGIASFAFPQYNMSITIRILRFPLMLLAATFGGLGIMVGLLLTYLHLSTLRSLGQPYLATIAPFQWNKLLDAFVEVPGHLRANRPGNRQLRKSGEEGRQE